MVFSLNRKSKWLITMILIITAPFIVFITPEIITFFLFHHEDSIALISYGKNFLMYGLSFLIIFIVIFTLYLIKRLILKVFIILIGLLLFFYINFIGIHYYAYLDENYIEYSPLLGESVHYDWNSIVKVFHELPTEQLQEKYIFELKNGQHLEILITDTLSQKVRNKIVEKMMTLEASYEEY